MPSKVKVRAIQSFRVSSQRLGNIWVSIRPQLSSSSLTTAGTPSFRRPPPQCTQSRERSSFFSQTQTSSSSSFPLRAHCGPLSPRCQTRFQISDICRRFITPSYFRPHSPDYIQAMPLQLSPEAVPPPPSNGGVKNAPRRGSSSIMRNRKPLPKLVRFCVVGCRLARNPSFAKTTSSSFCPSVSSVIRSLPPTLFICSLKLFIYSCPVTTARHHKKIPVKDGAKVKCGGLVSALLLLLISEAFSHSHAVALR